MLSECVMHIDSAPDNPCWASYLLSIAFQQLDPGVVEQYEWALRRKEKHTWADHGGWTTADRHRNSEHTLGNCWRKGARRLSASTTFTSPVPGNKTDTAQCSWNVVRIYNQLPNVTIHSKRRQDEGDYFVFVYIWEAQDLKSFREDKFLRMEVATSNPHWHFYFSRQRRLNLPLNLNL